MRQQGFGLPGTTVDAGPARAVRGADSGGPAALPARGKSTELAVIHVAKADPGMYEASAPYDQAPSPPYPGFGGSIVVQESGLEVAVAGAALILGGSGDLQLPVVSSRLAAEAALLVGAPIRASKSGARQAAPSSRCANRAEGPDTASIAPRGVYLFSRFFPSITRYELYKIGPGASARPNSGDVASRSSQRHCGYWLSLEADA
jgi:hypothetical protein